MALSHQHRLTFLIPALRHTQLADEMTRSMQQITSACWRLDFTFNICDHLRASADEEGKKAQAFEAFFSVMSGLGQVRRTPFRTPARQPVSQAPASSASQPVVTSLPTASRRLLSHLSNRRR